MKAQPRRAFARLPFLLAFSALLAVPAPAAAQTYIKRFLGIEATPPPASASEESVVTRARSYMGLRYRWGGDRPETGFDCSGFVRHIMRMAGVQLPRTSAQQARMGQEVPRDVSLLRVGDLITFGRGGRISHIGIYVGNGRYIHASSYAGRVTESPLPSRSWWQGARRVLVASSQADSMRLPGS
jgi:cell wall-associated NlpC family hydrolase